jgi:hypothetical protein
VDVDADTDLSTISSGTASGQIALRLGLAVIALSVGIVSAVLAIDVVRTVLS